MDLAAAWGQAAYDYYSIDYSLSNPVNYADPSGHCAGTLQSHLPDQEECWSTVEDIESNLSGQTTPDWLRSWDTPALQDLLHLIKTRSSTGRSGFVVNGVERLWLVNYFGTSQSIQNLGGSIDAVDAMARWIELTVAIDDGQGLGKDTIIDDLLLIENGFTKNRLGLPTYAPVGQTLGPSKFNDVGFHSDYQDGSDQVHHAMFYMALATDFPLGPYFSCWNNLYPETIDPKPLTDNGNFWLGKSIQDYRLGVRAHGLGLLFRVVPQESWGGWTRLYFKTGLLSVFPSVP